MTTQNPPCKFCEKQGLPILPIRFGVAPKRSFDVYKFNTAPPDATMLLGQPEVALDAPDTLYTGRMLRAGYLYVYYPSHRQWEAYAVDDRGCLSMVALTDSTPPGGDRFHESCARNATRVANASVLTIQDPETAGTVWIGFSDAWWTKTIRDKNAGLSDGERAKFMRKVDVTARYNGGQPGGAVPKHAFQVYQVDMLVAEYGMPIVDGAIAFAWEVAGGFAPFAPRSADTLKKECDALVPAAGLVLALQDPVGIARELPLYMQARWADFVGPYSRALKVDADLTQLQQIITRQAQDKLVEKFDFQQNGAEPLAEWALEAAGDGIVRGVRSVFGGAESHPEVAVPRMLNDANVKKYCDETWAPYAAVIDHGKRTGFKKKFAAESAAYNAVWMVPLATAHAAWMQSATTKAVFDHHYDPDDINTGVGFATVFTACVIGTAGLGECQRVYNRWLEEGAKASVPAMNLLWRAILLNHPELAAKVKTVHTGLADGNPRASDGWQGLFAAFQAVASKLHLKGEQATKSVTMQGNVATLTGELGGAMMRLIKHRDGAGNDLLAALGMHAGAPAKVVTVYGTLDDVNRSIFDTLDAMQPRVAQQVKHARMFELSRRMRIINAELVSNHINPYTHKVRSWRIVFDDSEPGAGGLDKLAPEQQARKAVARVKAVGPGPDEGVVSIDNAATKTIRALKMPGVASAFLLVFAGVNWHNAAGDVHTALAGQQTQAEVMLFSAVTGAMGAGFDVAKAGIAAALERPSMVGPIASIVSPTWLRFAKGGGAAGGMVGTLVAALVDIYDAISAMGDGATGLVALHGMRAAIESAVTGQLAVDLLVACGCEIELVILSGPAVWVAVVAVIAVGAVITMVEDPKPMGWAKACYFGVKPNADYDADEEREQLDYFAALGG